MKIKTKKMSYEQVMALKRTPHRDPKRPMWLLSAAIRLLCIPAMLKTRFTFTKERMELVGDQPCLILMNHSCFLDLKLAYRIFWPRPFGFVATTDGFVGLGWLMRLIGCIPTPKFVSDMTLIRDISYALKEKKTSVLMFPEASYSLDGRSAILPQHLGVLLKRLKVPVVTVRTFGAFARDPLYNGLQLRRVKVNAEVCCLLTPEEIREKSIDELDAMLQEVFTFDQFAWQRDNRVAIREKFRADGLDRVLYQCDCCGERGHMEGKGTRLTCRRCGRVHEMDEYGQLRALDGETRFAHIPDWYDWQREQVRREVEAGAYLLDTEVEIGVIVDEKAMYRVGSGRLVQTAEGCVLDGCDGRLHYEQPTANSYSLYVDYFWYEIGDMICIGTKDVLYYCFPRQRGVVTRARLAAEEAYKLQKGLTARKEA